MEGWIKLYRKLLDWQWFKHSEMVHLFVYLLVKANHVEGVWMGNKIEKGQLITGLNSLKNDTGISIQTLRTCLKRLEKSGEINTQTTNKYTIITVCNFDSYQESNNTSNKHSNKQLTNNQQTTNKQLTTNNNNKEYSEEYNYCFEDFWNQYNKKVGDKKKIEAKWIKLKQSDRDKIFETLPLFLSGIKDKQFQPYPETYLNNRRWEDEIPEKKEEETVTRLSYSIYDK